MRKNTNKIFSVDNYLICLFVISLTWAVFFFYNYLNNPIYDMHGFRQAQTAISVRYILESKSIFSYETPVLGYPWSIPFEFPTYQLLVRALVEITQLPIELAGRIVSFIFFLLTAYNGTLVLKTLGENRRTQLIFLILLFSSPLYLFWSRTVMIESTALYFASLYLYLFLRTRNDNKNNFYCISAGSLAALTKATTFAPFLLCGGLFFLKDFLRERATEKMKQYFLKSLALIIPLLIAMVWITHSDNLKIENPIANGFIDSKSLNTWNFGTISQKLSMKTWKQLFVRTENIMSNAWIVFCLMLLLFTKKSSTIIFFLISFFSAYLIFTNLHFVHEYYPFSNGIFLILAASLIISGILKYGRSTLPLVILTFIFASNYYEFSQTGHVWVNQTNPKITNLGQYIKSHTPANSVIITTGLDWSSELPFEANRRALMLRPVLSDFDKKYSAAKIALKNNNSLVSALVDCDQSDLSKRIIKDYNLNQSPAFSYDSCLIYVNN